MAKEWPPQKAPTLEKQSAVIDSIDRLLENMEKQKQTLRKLRVTLLVGWEFAGRASDYKKRMLDLQREGRAVRDRALYRITLRQWKKIKHWRGDRTS